MLTAADIVAECEMVLRHDLDERIKPIAFVNRIGRRWVNANGWNYLDGRTTEFVTEEGVSEYELPRDLARIHMIRDTRNLSPVVHMTTWEVLDSYEIAPVLAGFWRYMGAVNYKRAADGQTRPTLRLAPDPAGSETLRVTYRAGWTPLVEDTSSADLPVWAEEAFLSLARALALGFHRPSSAGDPSPVDRLAVEAIEGVEFQNAINADGEFSPDIPEGVGAMESLDYGMGHDSRPRSTRTDLYEFPG